MWAAKHGATSLGIQLCPPTGSVTLLSKVACTNSSIATGAEAGHQTAHVNSEGPADAGQRSCAQHCKAAMRHVPGASSLPTQTYAANSALGSETRLATNQTSEPLPEGPGCQRTPHSQQPQASALELHQQGKREGGTHHLSRRQG